MSTEIREVQIGDKVWTVRLTGNVVQIIDDQGRERHRSKGHMRTATFLTIELAKHSFESTENLDAALRKRAEEIPT